ncbi:MAG: hypothetical protein O7C75_11125, partial [Verrucomicrobia bacterium]|nr:hypothetical protein [Verrucomicrobiota bacterium]
LLGDTLILDPFDTEYDYVYVGTVHESKRWCLIETVAEHNNIVTRIIDKQNVQGESFQAITGFYYLSNYKLLKTCILEAIHSHKTELSSVLESYMNNYPIRAKQVQNWFDFGHIDNLILAKRRLLQTRYFNQLDIDPILNTIKKKSKNNQKLQDELFWYLSLPDDLKVLTPRIVSNKIHHGYVEIVQEYYGYATLAELYVYSDWSAGPWESIIKKLFFILREFRRYESILDKNDLHSMYISKTFSRLSLLSNSSRIWSDLISRRYIFCDNQKLSNIYDLHRQIIAYSCALSLKTKGYIIHGDFCFSNILYDVNSQIVRLVDPRGRFGKRSIYGDPRYDFAKLRQSIYGLYDFIMADLFEVTQESDSYYTQIYRNDKTKHIGDTFDRLLELEGFKLDEVKFLEGILFLSMVPLHKDQPNRQLMMYLTGLKLLNELLS